MRKLIDIINEATRPTRTMTDTDYDSLTSPIGVDNGDMVPVKPATTPDNSLASRSSTASADRTSQAYARGRAPEMARGMGNILRDLEGIEDTDPNAVTPGFDASVQHADIGHTDMLSLPGNVEATNENLPMVINQAIMGHGNTEIDFEPEWHQIQNLPGYIQTGIRSVARDVFRVFTNTPIEEIQMMCTLLDPEIHVQKVAHWIVSNGAEETSAEYDFREKMPEYARIAGATVAKMYRVGDYQFMIMRDNGGHYIYGWAGDNSKIAGMGDPLQIT